MAQRRKYAFTRHASPGLATLPRRAAGRKKAGEPSEAPKGRKKKAEAADKNEKSASPRKKPAKKAAKVTAAE